VFLPAVFGVGDLTGSVFRLEQDFTAGDIKITRLQRGLQVQQSLRLPNHFELLAGYRFRRNTTLAPGLPADPIDVAGLDLSLLRNTRDDVLDPRRGRFLSLNLELAPRVLGSDAPLVKGYAQADVARSFASGSLTWAQSYRLGLAWGFEGEPVISFERFFAGGPGSLRGFGTNEVGPRGPLGDPAGGEAVVILNQELRYRHASGLGAVVFYDLGNVFARVHDLRFDLRHTLGAGLRWASPVGLLRIDAGFPLDRDGDEKPYRLFFGLGQAF
jgi:outer membrane protein insertion porin family